MHGHHTSQIHIVPCKMSHELCDMQWRTNANLSSMEEEQGVCECKARVPYSIVVSSVVRYSGYQPPHLARLLCVDDLGAQLEQWRFLAFTALLGA